VEAEGGVGLAEGLFDVGGGRGAGEEEAEIGGAFGELEEVLAGLGGDDDVVDAGDGGGCFGAFDGFVDTGSGDGDHHDAGCEGIAGDGGNVLAEGVADDQVFERQIAYETEGAGAEAADGAGVSLEDPGARGVVAELGMDGAVAEAERGGGSGDGVEEIALNRAGGAGGGGVYGFFEVGALHRVGLIEDGEGVEAAGGHDGLDGEFGAGDVALALDAVLAHAADAGEGGVEFVGIIGADDAAAGGAADGLEDAGVGGAGGVLGGGFEEIGDGEAGGAVEGAGAELVVGGKGGVGRVEGEAEGLGGVGSEDGGVVADGADAVEGEAAEGGEGFGGAVEFDGDGAVTPRVVEDVAAVGGEGEGGPGAAGGGIEGVDLVAGGGGEEEETGHGLIVARLAMVGL